MEAENDEGDADDLLDSLTGNFDDDEEAMEEEDPELVAKME